MHITLSCCIFFHLFPSFRPHDRYNHALLPPVLREENSGFPAPAFFRLVSPQETELFFYDIPAYPSHHSLFRASLQGCLSSRTPSKIVEIFWEYPIPWELWKASEKDFSFLAFRRYLASAVAALPLHDKSSVGEGIANLS